MENVVWVLEITELIRSWTYTYTDTKEIAWWERKKPSRDDVLHALKNYEGLYYEDTVMEALTEEIMETGSATSPDGYALYSIRGEVPFVS